MVIEIGRRKRYLIGKEDTPGTKASTFYAVPRGSGNLNPKNEFAKDMNGIGQIEDITKSRQLHEWTEPALEMYAGDRSFGLLMLAALGSTTPSADDPEAGVTTHAYAVENTNNHVTFTLVEIDGVETKMATGCRLNTLNLTTNEDGFVTVNVTFMGQNEQTTTETPTYTEENMFLPKHRIVKEAADTTGLAGASNITLESVNFNINKNTEVYWGGSENPSQIVNKQFQVSGDITLAWEAATYKDYQFSDSKRAILLEFTNTDETIGTTTNPSFSFTLNQANLEEWVKEDGNDDFVMQTLGFVAEYKMSEGAMITGQAVNTVASY